MKCYSYNERSKVYSGEVDAQIDPLETRIQGKDVWILPANATLAEPPVVGKRQVAKWNGESWEVVADWTHCQLYNPKKKDEISISEIGQEKPKGYYPIAQRNETPYFEVEVKDDEVYFIDRDMNKQELKADAESKREQAYKADIDSLHARKTRKLILGTWTEDDESEYVETVKRLSVEIAERYPYPE